VISVVTNTRVSRIIRVIMLQACEVKLWLQACERIIIEKGVSKCAIAVSCEKVERIETRAGYVFVCEQVERIKTCASNLLRVRKRRGSKPGGLCQIFCVTVILKPNRISITVLRRTERYLVRVQGRKRTEPKMALLSVR
jgi:hypothetical protein